MAALGSCSSLKTNNSVVWITLDYNRLYGLIEMTLLGFVVFIVNWNYGLAF